MNIEKELQEYHQNQSRLNYLRKELLKLIDPGFLPDSVNYYSSPNFQQERLSETNQFRSKTETAGIKAAALSPKIEQKKQRIQEEIFFIQDKIHTINILLTGLDFQELFIIRHKYFHGSSWLLLSIEYQKEFGNPVSTDTLKRKRGSALKKMQKILR